MDSNNNQKEEENEKEFEKPINRRKTFSTKKKLLKKKRLECYSERPFRYICSIVDEKYKTKPVYDIKFNPFTDKKMFAAACHSRIVLMEYNGEDSIKRLNFCEVDEDSIYALSWGYDNHKQKTIIAAGGQLGLNYILDARTFKALGRLKSHTGAIFNLKFHPTKLHILASCGEDYSLRLWNARTMVCIAVFAGNLHESQVLSIEFDFNGEHLLSSSMDKEIVVWNIKELENVIGKSEHHENSRMPFATERVINYKLHCDFLHDDFVDSIVRLGASTFITRSASGQIIWWQLAADNEKLAIDQIHQFAANEEEESCWFVRMALDDQGRFLAVGDLLGNLIMWDLHTETLSDFKKSVFPTQNQKLVRMISFSSDGSTMVLGSDDGKIMIYDIVKKKEPVSNKVIWVQETSSESESL